MIIVKSNCDFDQMLAAVAMSNITNESVIFDGFKFPAVETLRNKFKTSEKETNRTATIGFTKEGVVAFDNHTAKAGCCVLVSENSFAIDPENANILLAGILAETAGMRRDVCARTAQAITTLVQIGASFPKAWELLESSNLKDIIKNAGIDADTNKCIVNSKIIKDGVCVSKSDLKASEIKVPEVATAIFKDSSIKELFVIMADKISYRSNGDTTHRFVLNEKFGDSGSNPNIGSWKGTCKISELFEALNII